MPPLISDMTTRPVGVGLDGDMLSVDFGYNYPKGLNLRPGTEEHAKLRNFIWSRAIESSRALTHKREIWKNVTKTLTLSIRKDEEERALQAADETTPISVVVPTSYAMLETLLTHLSSAFLGDRVIFKYAGVGPEDTIGAMLLEEVIALQLQRTKAALALHTMWRDSFCYGIGIVSPKWIRKKHKARRTERVEFEETLAVPGTGRTIERVVDVIFEGNELENIDPFLYLPDPNFSSHDVQKGEFVGWVVRDNRMSLLEQEAQSEGEMFNVKYLQFLPDARSTLHHEVGEGRRARSVRREDTGITTNPVDVTFIYANIIPKELNLGDKESPEKWMFALAGDTIIIQASPVNLNHNMFPVVVASPDYDGYSIVPTSRLEVIEGLQTVVNFLFNSHIANLRKAVNDMWIVDPQLVNMNDLRSPKPGKFIRTTPNAWGRGVENVIKQFPVNDVTRQNIVDSSFVEQLMRMATGASEIISGIRRRGGERISAFESQSDQIGALSRVEKDARIISAQAMQDIGFMMASHTQQLMTKKVYVNIAQRLEDELKSIFETPESVEVSPNTLLIDYDVRPFDASAALGQSSALWIQLFQTITTQPEVSAQFDLVRIFRYIAKLLGAKNLQEFAQRAPPVRAEVLPDQAVQEGIAAGTLVPAENL